MAAAPNKTQIRLAIEPLTPAAFSAFGNVISNPSNSNPADWPSVPSSSSANQGTATKYSDVTHLTNHYGLAPSRKPAQPLSSMFVCHPRPLLSAQDPGTHTLPYPATTKTVSVPVLERHPYTSQTFTPLGLSPSDRNTAYLVIVAPTMPVSSRSGPRAPPYPIPAPEEKPRKSALRRIFSRARPEPFTNSFAPSSAGGEVKPWKPSIYDSPSVNAPADDFKAGATIRPAFSSIAEYKARHSSPLTETLFVPRGQGRPDLGRARAFVAHGGQAVTYAPGTWHAPMIVVGERSVEFVVWQWGNGVPEEDCQEVEVGKKGAALEVVVGEAAFGARPAAKAKL